MALNLDGTTQYGTINSSPITSGETMTISLWARRGRSSVGVSEYLSMVGDATGAALIAGLRWSASNALQFRVTGGNGTDTGATVTDTNWHHCLGVNIASNDRWTYLDGTGTQNTANAPLSASLFVETKIGAYLAETNFFQGDLAEVAYWDVALDTAEIAALRAAASPLMIRPGNLVLYAPLVRNANDWMEARSFTLTGSPSYSAHPRIIMPRKKTFFVPAAAGGGSVFNPYYYRNFIARGAGANV